MKKDVCVCVHTGSECERLQGGHAEVTPHLVYSTAWWEIREQRRRERERSACHHHHVGYLRWWDTEGRCVCVCVYNKKSLLVLFCMYHEK